MPETPGVGSGAGRVGVEAVSGAGDALAATPTPIGPQPAHDHGAALAARPLMFASGGLAGLARFLSVEDAEGAGGLVAPAAPEAEVEAVTARLHAATGSGPSFLRWLDGDGNVEDAIRDASADGVVTADELVKVIAAAKDYGGINDDERKAILGMLEQRGARLDPAVLRGLARFLGVSVSEPPPPPPLLAQGDKGPAVARLQTLLGDWRMARGHGRIAQNGASFSAQTTTALKEFQKAAGLPQTGKSDEATWAALAREAAKPPALAAVRLQTPALLAVARGEGTIQRGEPVATASVIQSALAAVGLPVEGAPGLFGPRTEEAVRAFQRRAGLADTGVVDAAFLKALDAEVIRAGKPIDVSALEKMDGKALLRQGGIPGGGAAAIGDVGGVRFSKAYGTGKDGAAIPDDALFDLASMSKLVGTGTATMLLIDDGTLSLDDPVSKWFPEFAKNGKEAITIRQLISHSSGLPAGFGAAWVDGRYSGDSDEKLLKAICDARPGFTPGTNTTYSDLNMALMAMIVEKASGKTMEALLSERVYGPLGMTDTHHAKVPASKLGRTLPTAPSVHGVVHDPTARLHARDGATPGNAGLFSTTADLSKWARMVLNGGELDGKRILSPASADLFFQTLSPPGARARGASSDMFDGWSRYDFSPQPGTPPSVGHFGFTGTLIVLDKESKSFAISLTNQTWPRSQQQADRPFRNTVLERWNAAYRFR